MIVDTDTTLGPTEETTINVQSGATLTVDDTLTVEEIILHNGHLRFNENKEWDYDNPAILFKESTDSAENYGFVFCEGSMGVSSTEIYYRMRDNIKHVVKTKDSIPYRYKFTLGYSSKDFQGFSLFDFYNLDELGFFSLANQIFYYSTSSSSWVEWNDQRFTGMDRSGNVGIRRDTTRKGTVNWLSYDRYEGREIGLEIRVERTRAGEKYIKRLRDLKDKNQREEPVFISNEVWQGFCYITDIKRIEKEPRYRTFEVSVVEEK